MLGDVVVVFNCKPARQINSSTGWQQRLPFPWSCNSLYLDSTVPAARPSDPVLVPPTGCDRSSCRPPEIVENLAGRS